MPPESVVKHTEWDVMIGIHRDVLTDFGLVDILEYCESMADTCNAHFFQFLMLQCDECLSYNFIHCLAH